MTKRDLLTYFEEFYGEKYSGVFLDIMTSYLDGFSEKFYKSAASVIVKRFSRIYNKAPDPSIFEKHMEEILKSIPEPVALPEIKQRMTEGEYNEIMAEYRQREKAKAEKEKKEGRVKRPFSRTLTKTLNSLGGNV